MELRQAVNVWKLSNLVRAMIQNRCHSTTLTMATQSWAVFIVSSEFRMKRPVSLLSYSLYLRWHESKEIAC